MIPLHYFLMQVAYNILRDMSPNILQDWYDYLNIVAILRAEV